MNNAYRSVFGKPAEQFSEAGYRALQKATARSVASRFTRGNIAVQNGYFLLPEDLERKRKMPRKCLQSACAELISK